MHHGRMNTAIPGASPWTQKLYDHLVSHVENERDVLVAYDELAASTDSPAFAYLARLILDDERRHHAMLDDLAATIRANAELSPDPLPIPDLAMFRADRSKILAQTEWYLDVEREDQRMLAKLRKELRDVRDTTIWELVVRLIQHDNEKHRMILEFVRDRAEKPT